MMMLKEDVNNPHYRHDEASNSSYKERYENLQQRYMEIMKVKNQQDEIIRR